MEHWRQKLRQTISKEILGGTRWIVRVSPCGSMPNEHFRVASNRKLDVFSGEIEINTIVSVVGVVVPVGIQNLPLAMRLLLLVWPMVVVWLTHVDPPTPEEGRLAQSAAAAAAAEEGWQHIAA